MKIETLIKRLQNAAKTHGNIDVTVKSDQEEHPEGKPVESKICFVRWKSMNKKGKTKVDSLMLCDRATFWELG